MERERREGERGERKWSGNQKEYKEREERRGRELAGTGRSRERERRGEREEGAREGERGIGRSGQEPFLKGEVGGVDRDTQGGGSGGAGAIWRWERRSGSARTGGRGGWREGRGRREGSNEGAGRRREGGERKEG